MSILIKGMKMPSVGTGKVIMIDSDGDVWTAGKDECTIITGAKAIPVPPHGRLGDLDELEKSFREDADEEWNRFAAPVNWADAFDDVANIIADAPTIIPAEEEV